MKKFEILVLNFNAPLANKVLKKINLKNILICAIYKKQINNLIKEILLISRLIT